MLKAKYKKASEETLNNIEIVFGWESTFLKVENIKATAKVEANQPISTRPRKRYCPKWTFSPKNIALGTQTVIQNIQRTPLAKIMADIVASEKCTFWPVSIF